MAKLYLQNIIDDISFETLPITWQGFDFERFSKDKTLFDFQQDALKNALRGLWLYFENKNADKQRLFNHYKLNEFEGNFDYNLKKKQDGKTAKYLLEYDKDYPVIDSKISFSRFINRMSFWMATGSGKTLVIVKLIELLGLLISKGEIPKNDILFLTHRDDLLDQFKNHIEEFNNFNFNTKINLKNLKDYENVKRENTLPFTKNEITVFYYRSDLISDKQKEKIVNFRNYDNSGKWYILLDEAHKGDKEDSKRQILYSILSRNGFLFNFSATFTDPRDFATCAFNFNLSRFVEEGYGKHIYVSKQDITAFRNKTDFSKQEKQKIVLKTLLFLTYINKHFEKIRDINNILYHHPLLLTLVNSVSVEDSDLELFFKEIEKIAQNKIEVDLLQKAKEEIAQEFLNNTKFEFEELECTINTDLILKIDYKDILKYVFNAKTPGKIEVLKIPGNRQELIFRLMTADKPFALIKIGDISNWLKDKLEGYEINESFENKSYFKQINHDDSDINILMGSRSFYEGWDSNRPNLLLFVNIGIGSDAKKFVLQSVGRGIRIEPQKYQRKRLQNLFNAGEVKEQLFKKVKNLILPIESLFVFGTNAKNLEEIIKTLKEEKQEKNLGEAFILNPETQKRLLLIPVYKTTEEVLAEEQTPQNYPISYKDFNITSQFYKFINDKVALVKYDCEVKVLKKAEESFDKKEQYYDFSESNSLLEPELILGRIFDYFGIKNKKFDKFKKLENEIVHFKKVRFSDEEKYYEEIRKKIEEVRHYPERQKELDEQYGKIPRKEFEKQMTLFEQTGNFEIRNQKIKIKYLANHYYLPVIVSETERIDYINHIINVDSEIKFIEKLEEYLTIPNNVFNQFDWWMFSKLDQTLDDVFIPFYNHKNNRMDNYHPDFIFWLQKGNNYLILFVDPHGTAYSDINKKIDYYSKIFEIEDTKKSKKFLFDGFNIETRLLLMPAQGGLASVGNNYKKYWFNDFVDFANKIKIQQI
ncbi:MAG: DEAD/DEAH box helicase family protein [Parcubacteria group bacterium]|nr:DEAD/DEAH box helicase family protein [Parcubacteria group bacterium]